MTKKSKDKVNTMSLMQQWEDMVSVFNNDAKAQQKFWTDYYLQEKGMLGEEADGKNALRRQIWDFYY